MARRVTWGGVILVVAVVLLAGVVSVRVDWSPPRWASGEFWTTVKNDAPLPAPLALWVELARAARPAVVNVSALRGRAEGPAAEFFRRFFEGDRPAMPRASLGTGFLISSDGFILTNNHVVAAGSDIIVKLDRGSEHPAKIIGTDPATDLALLKIEVSGLPALPLGDSDRLQVGEPVMAIGNPFGLDQTVTTGIVSAKERFIGSGPYDDFIQTDASVNPGNSGGPLIDSRGAAVGINTAIFSQSGGSVGIGFAIPINLAKTVLLQLRERGGVVRGWLGVALRPVTSDTAEARGLGEARGVVVEGVVAGSPADRAGMRKGDVLVAFEKKPIAGPSDLTRRIAGIPPGTRVEVSVIRDGAQKALSVELGRLPDQRGRPLG